MGYPAESGRGSLELLYFFAKYEMLATADLLNRRQNLRANLPILARKVQHRHPRRGGPSDGRGGNGVRRQGRHISC